LALLIQKESFYKRKRLARDLIAREGQREGSRKHKDRAKEVSSAAVRVAQLGMGVLDEDF
jgi:hypothetical protein